MKDFIHDFKYVLKHHPIFTRLFIILMIVAFCLGWALNVYVRTNRNKHVIHVDIDISETVQATTEYTESWCPDKIVKIDGRDTDETVIIK
jgi:hypothetical protein